LISTNRFTDEMLEKFKVHSNFDLQDKFSISLVHHETKLNMIPYPNQNIKEWIEKKETYVNILQPLQVLNG